MDDADLEKIGNANLRINTKNPYVPNQQHQFTPSKLQQNHSFQKFYKPQSNIPNQSHLQFHQFNGSHYDFHGKCTKLTKTKWDSFAPYMFNKLSKQQKDQTFLNLYDDYRGVKNNLNKQYHKSKRLLTKLHLLQQQLSRIKSKQPNSKKVYTDNDKQKQIHHQKQEIKRLHQKILALTDNKHKVSTRPKTANKNQKIIIPANQNVRAQLQLQKKHVRELLLIIDELKKNKFTVQQQLKTSQANQPKLSRSFVNNSQKKPNKNSQLQFQQYANDLYRWKQKYNDLQLTYNKMNENKDKKIKQLTSQLVNIKQNQKIKLNKFTYPSSAFNQSQKQRLQQKVRQITHQKQKLQIQLRRLVQTPFYQTNSQSTAAQQKIIGLQLQNNKIKNQLAITSDNNTKYLTQLQFKNRENNMLKSENQKIKKQYKDNFNKQLTTRANNVPDIDYDDYFRKKLALVKLEGNDPVWKQFQAIAKPEINLMNQQALRSLAQKLWLNKIQLLSHLEKAQIQLKSLRQSTESRIHIYIAEKQQLQNQLRITNKQFSQWKSMDRIKQKDPYKIYQQNGIKYDDTISVFDIDDIEIKQLKSNQNYFDLYLGNLHINESQLMKNTQNKVKNTTHFLSFLTIDFYNHQTQRSGFVQGISKKLGDNFSFKVQIDSCLIKYFSKNSISLSLWSPQGSANVLLGKGEIYLSELASKKSPDVSTVVRSKCQFFNDRSLIATLQFRCRMRLPISQFLQQPKNNTKIKVTDSRPIFLSEKQRILQISVDGAEGLPEDITTFVYFNIQQQQFFTEPERGSSPTWNFKQQMKVKVDQQFIQNMKQNYFKFTIFDDEKQLSEDIFGIAKANFTPLVQQKDSVNLIIDIIQQNSGNKKGKLKIRARWVTY